MNCPNCQYENNENAKFCQNCGHKLQQICPNCSTPNDGAAKFCQECGTRLGEAAPEPTRFATPAGAGAAPSLSMGETTKTSLQRFIPRELLSKINFARESGTMVGERRIVTMLFSDVKGSTAAAGQLDPEEWAEIMNGAFEHMIQPVYKYEGTIARLMGDAILAFFGAPIAHEDDPERAVRAGLEIVEGIQPYRTEVKRRWGLDFDVRVGINTGLVVVGAVGSDMRMEYTALGDAINLAARMEQTAVPGTVQIAGPTYKQVVPFFEFEELGGIEVKGKSEPVQAYRVLGAKALRGKLRGIEGLSSPLVGRDGEMHTLRGTIIELRKGRGQIVSVIGEAGLGKSRIVAELRQAPTPIAGSKNVQLRWREGRSLSYQTTSPYTPFINWFTECFELEPGMTPEEKYLKINSQIEMLSPGEGARIAPFIAALMGLTPVGVDNERIRYLEPPQLRHGIFNAVGHYAEHLAHNQPTVLVFDDVHWIDPTSLELLESLLPITERAPLMILAVFRPHRQEPSWRFHELAQRDFGHRYHPVFLNPLDQQSSRELVANLLEVEDLPEKVRLLILEKAEGNPFFVEEVIRSLLDARLVVNRDGRWFATAEIEHIAVPDTLAAVITTRLDRLEDEAKQVVQTASVIGREFLYNVLEEVDGATADLDQTLMDIERRELVREKARLPERLYFFKHALTQETAYNSLLLRKRREVHRRVAECLESNETSHPGDIARHFMEARLTDRALPYLLDAADRAAHAFATPEAINYYEQAVHILESVQDVAPIRRAYEGLSSAYAAVYNFPKAVETLQKMLELAEALDDIPMQVSAHNKLGWNIGFGMMQFEKGLEHLYTGEKLAREYEEVNGLFEAQMFLCGFCMSQGDFDGALHQFRSALELGQKVDLVEAKLYGLSHTGNTLVKLTRFDEAWSVLQEAYQLALEHEHRKFQSEILLGAMANYYLVAGEFAKTRETLIKGMAIAEEINDYTMQAFGSGFFGLLDYQQGAYESSIQWFQRAFPAGQLASNPWAQTWALYGQGSSYLPMGPALLETGLSFHKQAQMLIDQMNGMPAFAVTWNEMGVGLLAEGKPEEAMQAFQNGLDKPSSEMHLLHPFLVGGKAQAALVLGDLEEAERFANEALKNAEERKLVYAYPFLALIKGEISAARGEWEAALEHFTRAEQLALDNNMRPIIWQARAGAGHIHKKQGKEELASQKFRSAQMMVNEIADLFEDKQLRQHFLNHAQRKINLS